MRAPQEPEHRDREMRGAYVEPMEAPMMTRDLTRWGPVWSGVVAAVGTIVVLSILGAAVGLVTVGTGTLGNLLSAEGIWGAIVMFIGLFIGGWLAARTTAMGGSMTGLIHGSLVWALLVFISVILASIGAGAAFGAILGNFGAIIVGAPGAASISTGNTWGLFAVLVIGLIVAAVGGWIGSRSTYEAPPR